MKCAFFITCLVATVLVVSGCVQQPGSPGASQQGNPMPPPGGQNASQMPPAGRQNAPLNQPAQGGEPVGAPLANANGPLPSLPSGVPKGEWVTKKLGDVEIRYFSTAIARGMTESGTDFFIYLNNTGSAKATLCFPSLREFTQDVGTLRSSIPDWNLHFFALQDPPMDVGPGQKKSLWYFASLDVDPTKGNSFFTVNFTISECGQGSASASVMLPVIFGVTGENFMGKETSYIYGTVKDEDGNPVTNAEIRAAINCGRVDFRGGSDGSGNYKVEVLAKEDIDAIYVGKPLTCDSTDYFVTVEQPGYEYYYSGHAEPTRQQPQKLDIVLKKSGGRKNYTMDWEKKVDDNYGFFWVKPSADWSVFAAAQAKHPPMLNKPTNFYLFDSSGNILWKQPTGNECWGIDITSDGSKVVAGCTDRKIYAVDRAGKLLWSASTIGAYTISRNLCFSRDGTRVLAGDTPMLIDTATGTEQAVPWNATGQRNCAFYYDDSGFVIGAREVTGFDASGTQKWQNVIGEFPLFMDVDNNKNTFGAGKSRTLFSFDANGNLRWKHKIPDHVITAGAATPDGSRMALGTVGGMVYVFDGDGNLLWKRNAMEPGNWSSIGHNAVTISEDGKEVVVGTTDQAGVICVLAYNGNGTIVWENCVQPDKSNPDLLLQVTHVQISNDKKQIIASYGDNYIRKFSLAG